MEMLRLSDDELSVAVRRPTHWTPMARPPMRERRLALTTLAIIGRLQMFQLMEMNLLILGAYLTGMISEQLHSHVKMEETGRT